MPELDMVNPNRLVEEIIELYSDIAAKKGIELTSNLTPDLKEVPLDPKGIHTCLTNLVSNAIDACLMSDKKGGEVCIGTGNSQGLLRFTVSDNGMGIDYEIKQKLFTTYFTTKGGEGTGLGLLTTRKIVQEHGGKITVRSRKGRGSQFTMSFPKKRLIELYRQKTPTG
jgi:signal transduction histidine kinase